MKLSQLYIIFCWAILLAGCAQMDFPEPTEGVPVFKITANIGGEPIDIAAGLNDYYMFTSYEKDDLEIFVFTGELKQETCPETCAEQLRIEIRDNEVATADPSNIENVLSNELTFSTRVSDETEKYRVSFHSSNIGTEENIVSYLWDFGDGTTSTLAHPEHEYIVAEKYTVRLETIDAIGCQSSQTQVIDLANLNERCAIYIEGAIVQNDRLQLNAIGTFDPASILFLWDIDSTLTTPFLVEQSNTYCVQLLDSSVCAANSCATVTIDSIDSFTYCTTSFDYEVNIIPIPPIEPLQLGTITVIYTDALGRVYRSDSGIQVNPFLNITNVEEFDVNENGEKTKKMDIQLSCLLFAENGDILELENAALVFGVAYP